MSTHGEIDYESIPQFLRPSCERWLSQDRNTATRSEIMNLICNRDWNELHNRFDARIAFGTAGLRARMEAGFSRMNTLVVIQATQGLALYVKRQFPDNLVAVVGHDHRHHSHEFAAVTAATFLEAGFKVYYLNDKNHFTHTPMVPFTVDQVEASVGVMITASHNPKMDNGYKVYYANGCQIIPPHDKGIAASIDENLNLWTNAWKSEEVIDSNLARGTFIYAQKEMTSKYVSKMCKSLVIEGTKSLLETAKPWFVYTAMHGVGGSIFSRIMGEILGLKSGRDYLEVEQQCKPDPDFPTVSFPNPEEKGALDLSIALADRNGISLVLANDPDADRFSAAVKKPETGKWQQLSGNQIGFLFAYYEFQCYEQKSTEFKKSHPLAMLSSTVSSQMIKRMAEIEGFYFEDTLTGFKWIGNRAISLVQEGYYIPFSFEEAIGYMFPQMEFDKDGISAAVVFLQAYKLWSSNSHKNPLDLLKQGYERYGFFKEYNGYFYVSKPEILIDLFAKVRQYRNMSGKCYPTEIGSEFDVISFRDLTLGFQSDTKDHKPTLPVDPSSQMITVAAKLRNSDDREQIRFTLRGSGTEPKLKVYIESCAQSESRALSLAKLASEVLQREWLMPGVGGLSKEFHRT